MTPRTYVMDSDAQALEVLSSLGDRFSLRDDPPSEGEGVYLDSFDGRLYRAGRLLIGTPHDGAWLLRLADTDGNLRHREIVRKLPRFVADFAEGELRAAIAPLLEMRCVLPTVRLHSEGQTHRVLDANEKTVVWVDVERARALPGDARRGEGHPLPPVLRLAPVRGYESALREVAEFVESDFELVEEAEGLAARALRAVGLEPMGQSSKLDLTLDPDWSTGTALRMILARLLDIIELNQPGTRADLDSEFLHDLRVATRRTRTVLGQFKQVLPPGVLEHVAGEFRWLGSVTGPTRDLDVYLLNMPEYREELPPQVQADLDPLQSFLEKRRREEQRKLKRVLGGKRFRALVEGWRGFVSGEPGSEDPAVAHRPISVVAGQIIERSFRKVVRKGGRITPATPAIALHELRIDCKKLRYLLEFFRSLYAQDTFEPMIKSLKKLQDNLGILNDLYVQQETLTGWAHEMVDAGVSPPSTVLAMGRLLERLAEREISERTRFERCFALFATADNEQRMLQIRG